MTRLQWFLNQIIWFWGGITWKGQFIGTAIRDWLVDAYIKLAVGVLNRLEADWVERLLPLLDRAEATGEVPSEIQPLLDEMRHPSKPIGAFLGQATAAGATGGLISSTMGPYLLLLQYNIQRHVEQWRFDPLTALAVWIRSQELPEADKLRGQKVAEEDADDSGISHGRWEWLKFASWVRLEADDIILLRRRGEIDKAEYQWRMQGIGYLLEEAESLYQAREVYPTPADMTRFADFGAFDPEIIAMWRDYYDAPSWIREPMAKIGIIGDWPDKYWFSHWQQPGRYEMGEMHRRRLLDPRDDSKQDEIVRKAYLTQGYSGFWQDRLLKLAQEPLTRVDIRRMHKVGLLSKDELSEAYRAVGFYGVNNQRMVDFTIKYNEAEDRDLTKSDILSSLSKGVLTRTEAETRLAELDYPPEEISVLIDKALWQGAKASRELTKTNLRQLYQAGITKKAEITGHLAGLGYDAASITALFDLWDWEAPPRLSRPTRAQLDRMLSNEVIGFDDWVLEYRGLGYVDRYISWYFDDLLARGKVE